MKFIKNIYDFTLYVLISVAPVIAIVFAVLYAFFEVIGVGRIDATWQ